MKQTITDCNHTSQFGFFFHFFNTVMHLGTHTGNIERFALSIVQYRQGRNRTGSREISFECAKECWKVELLRKVRMKEPRNGLSCPVPLFPTVGRLLRRYSDRSMGKHARAALRATIEIRGTRVTATR